MTATPHAIERRECGRCHAEVREGKTSHFCGEGYPLKVTKDIRVTRYVLNGSEPPTPTKR